MAKALEGILGGITKTPGQPGASPNYNSGTLTETSEYMKEFSEINASTEEGLKKYRELTGLPTKGISARKIDLTARQAGAELEERFTDYTHKHIKSEIGELNEQTQAFIGYSFCSPEGTGSGKYRNTSATVHTAKETIKKIEDDSKKYVEEQIEAAPDFMKGIIGRMPDQVCAIDAEDARTRAFRAIAEYGSADFTRETYAHQVAEEKRMQVIGEKLATKRSELEQNMRPGLDAEEQAKYFSEINNGEAMLREKMAEIADPNRLRMAIVDTAIATIKDKDKKSSK